MALAVDDISINEAAAFTCDPGGIYSLTRPSGTDEAVVARYDTISKVVDENIARFTSSTAGAALNALAVSADGESFFAVDQSDANAYATVIHRTTLGASNSEIVASGDTDVTQQMLVGGAISPVTGIYYFGGYESMGSGTTARFQLYAFDPDRTDRGFEQVTTLTADAGTTDTVQNGDIAFDAAGNLYLLWSGSGGAENELWQFDASWFSGEESGADLPDALSPDQTLGAPDAASSQAYNGMTLGSDGRLYVQRSTGGVGSGTALASVDSNTLTEGHFEDVQIVSGSIQGGVDLASCALPPAITLVKDVVDRRELHPADQFALTIVRDEATLAEGLTSGSDLGVQETARVGPVIAVAGGVYTIGESAASGTELPRYQSSWRCFWGKNESLVLASGTGTSGNFTIPAEPLATEIDCVITNTPLTRLSLEKRVADEQNWGAGATAADFELRADSVEFEQGEPTTVIPSRDRDGDGAYHLDETFASDSEIESRWQSGYALESITCRVDSGEAFEVPLVGDGANRVHVADGSDTVCTLTNTALPGELAFTKADAATDTPLGGSQWRLTGPNGFDEVLVDNEGQSDYAGIDTDPAPGAFHVQDLAWGDYTLTETTAPVGYDLLTRPISRTVTGGPADPADDLIGNDSTPLFTLEKYAYPNAGAVEPELIDGARFAVFNDASAETLVPGAAVTPDGDTGRFAITGLSAGERYWIVETVAPDEHSLMPEPIEIEVVRDAGGVPRLTLVTDSDAVTVSDDGLVLQVVDPRSVTLPIAGSIGLWPFAAGGALLLLVAIYVVLRPRRRGSASA